MQSCPARITCRSSTFCWFAAPLAGAGHLTLKNYRQQLPYRNPAWCSAPVLRWLLAALLAGAGRSPLCVLAAAVSPAAASCSCPLHATTKVKHCLTTLCAGAGQWATVPSPGSTCFTCRSVLHLSFACNTKSQILFDRTLAGALGNCSVSWQHLFYLCCIVNTAVYDSTACRDWAQHWRSMTAFPCSSFTCPGLLQLFSACNKSSSCPTIAACNR
jgi:hypothetical protein